MTKRTVVLLIVVGFGLGACSSSGGSRVASFCNLAKKDSQDFTNLGTSDANFALDKIENAAPSAINSDFKTLADYVDGLSADRVPSTADIATVETASVNVTKYVTDVCKVNLSYTTPPVLRIEPTPG